MSLLGFKKKQTKLGNVIIWDEEVVERIKQMYGFSEEEHEDMKIKAPKKGDI